MLVLERGRRWTPDTYPREPTDAWIWDQDRPEAQHGWIDLRFMDDMWVAQGAGVGGGSLIYANISIDAKPAAFAAGWPSEISYDRAQAVLRTSRRHAELAAAAGRPAHARDSS